MKFSTKIYLIALLFLLGGCFIEGHLGTAIIFGGSVLVLMSMVQSYLEYGLDKKEYELDSCAHCNNLRDGICTYNSQSVVSIHMVDNFPVWCPLEKC
jgi:hypothetical protein